MRIHWFKFASSAALSVAMSSSIFAAAAQQPLVMGHATQLIDRALTPPTAAKLTVTSPAFKNGDEIPTANTQYGGSIFPGLSWTRGPKGTRSYAVIVQGQSLVKTDSATSIHLTLYNLPARMTTLEKGMVAVPAGAIYGPNVHGMSEPYVGPHAHTASQNGYHYEVLALDTVLPLTPGVEFDELVDAMKGHVLASGDLMGMAAKEPSAAEQAAAPAAGIPNTVHVESGLLTGVPGRDASITVYKGVPYAAPPVGDLRFRAPQPPPAWQGVRQADHFGNTCPQSGGNKANMSEDCLFANIWAGPVATTKKPVFVWIYGGGFSGGSGSDPTFDGEALAKKGLVVVTFNYRLGALGFLATPELSKESGHNASGNFGLLDDIAMLQWVRKNISAFGGDPYRVTIGGQSAGAGSVGFLAMSPLAKGLFQRAIQESHARYSRDTELRYLAVSWRALPKAEEQGVKFAAERGAHNLKELRALPWDKLLVSMANSDDSVETGSNNKPPLFRPVVDGWVIPKDYDQTYASGTQNDVEVLAGNNRDETGAVPESTFARRGLTVQQFQEAAKRKFGPLADEFLKVYPASTDEEAALASNEAARDNSRISTYLWGVDWKQKKDKPVYTYFFTHRPTGDPGGAHHTAEILFVFNNLYLKDTAWTEEDHKVADTISSYWVNYIATGNPNGRGLPNWLAFDPKSPTVMELGDHFAPMPVASSEARMDFWKRFFATQPAW